MNYLFIAVVLLSVSNVAWAEVYKWTDEHGRTHYSDKPIQQNQPPVQKYSRNLRKQKSPVITYPDNLKLNIRKLFVDEDFKKLNQLLDKYQRLTESNIQNEGVLFAAYDTFKMQDPAYSALFDKWLLKTPETYQPYLARAAYYYQQGWDKRGGKWSNQTSNKQFSGMRRAFDNAKSDYDRALKINKSLILPYCPLMRIASATGENYQKKILFNRGMSVDKLSYQLRRCYLKTITPRWGGSFEEMAVFVDENRKYYSKNNQLKLLEGLVLSEAGEMLSLKKEYKESEKLFTQALQHGEAHHFYYNRGKARYRGENYINALSDFNRAIELRPEDAGYYYWRSKTYEELNNIEKAVRDIKLSKKYNPFDKYTNEYMAWLAKSLYRKGYDLYKSRNFKQSVAMLDYAINLYPEHAEYYYWRSKVNIDQNKRSLAYTDLKRAIELDEDNFDYYLLMDWLLAKNRKWPEIIAYWDRYIQIDSGNSRAYLERGGAYYRMGDIKSAVENAKVSADMGNPEGKQAYERFRHLVN